MSQGDTLISECYKYYLTIKVELPASVKSTKVQCNVHTCVKDHLEPVYIICLFHHKHGTIAIENLLSKVFK